MFHKKKPSEEMTKNEHSERETEKTTENTEETVEADEVCEQNNEVSPETLLSEQKLQYEQLFDKFQRNMAEFDNFRKRTAKEKISMYDDGVRDTIEKLLPIIDNFERALDSASNKENDNFYKGVEMILRQLTGMFQEIGVTQLPEKGSTFDPNIHHAVAHVDDAAYGENEVIEVLQKGYQYKNKVIRHSMVKVAN